jgi:hypothetical protein
LREQGIFYLIEFELAAAANPAAANSTNRSTSSYSDDDAYS